MEYKSYSEKRISKLLKHYGRSVHGNLIEAGNFLEDVSQPRYGTLPPLSLDRYMRAVFEPHNAMAHVTQNFMNFCMGTVFWVTAAAIYERVNPPEYSSYPFRHYDKVSISSTFYKQFLCAQIKKAQKDSQVVSLFCAFGICACKSCL